MRFDVADEASPPPAPPRAAHAPAAGGAAPDKNPGAAAPARGRRRIVLDAGDLSPAYRLQDCGAVRIILPLRVAKELDGLKIMRMRTSRGAAIHHSSATLGFAGSRGSNSSRARVLPRTGPPTRRFWMPRSPRRRRAPPSSARATRSCGRPTPAARGRRRRAPKRHARDVSWRRAYGKAHARAA